MAISKTPRLSPADYPCLSDSASVVGLEGLARRFPADWPTLLRLHAPTARLHLDVTVGEVIGSALDAAALPRGRRDLGRLRHARWCASVLRRHASDVRLLGVDGEAAARFEWALHEDHGLAPGTARKVSIHLLALRDSVGVRLGAPRPDAIPMTSPLPWRPRLDWERYARLAEELPWEHRVATGLLVTCRLRPATVLAARCGDVGAGGRTIRVRGRRARHVLPVPAFLREDLAALARGGGPRDPLWPGRTAGGTMGPTALRRRLQQAARTVLDEALDLRDLADLAASALGPGSGNPAGRRAALADLAPRWTTLEQPPDRRGAAASGDSQEPGHDLDAVVRELDELRSLISGVRIRQDRMEARACDDREAADKKLTRISARVQALRSEVAVMPRGQSENGARLGAVRKKMAESLATERLLRQCLAADLKELRASVIKLEKSVETTRTATIGNTLPLLALLLDRALHVEAEEQWRDHVGQVLEALGSVAEGQGVPLGPDVRAMLTSLLGGVRPGLPPPRPGRA